MKLHVHSNNTICESRENVRKYRGLSFITLITAFLTLTTLNTVDSSASIQMNEGLSDYAVFANNNEQPFAGGPTIWRLEDVLGVDIDGDGIIGEPPSTSS